MVEDKACVRGKGGRPRLSRCGDAMGSLRAQAGRAGSCLEGKTEGDREEVGGAISVPRIVSFRRYAVGSLTIEAR